MTNLESFQTQTPLASEFKLNGFNKFVRVNTMSDRFHVKRFHHIEFWCGDATNTSRRFSLGLGIPVVAKSDLSTSNSVHASYLLDSHTHAGKLCLLFTSAYSPSLASPSSATIPTFATPLFNSFITSHGLGVRAIAIEVEDAHAAFDISVSNGAIPSSAPIVLQNGAVLAEVHLYGDVVLRYISYPAAIINNGNGNGNGNNNHPNVWFFPGFEKMPEETSFRGLDFGLKRLEHAVGNVPELGPAFEYVKKFTGFHKFAEFAAQDVRSSDSALNSAMLADNAEMVLIAFNEPVYGTPRRSQIQTYLEHNEGPGVQHVALMTDDIFSTVREMRKQTALGGFDFMPPPPPTYYRNLPTRAQDVLTEEQMNDCQELGVLVDRDHEGMLLQIFTQPIGDRPTMFIEIIQRIGCMVKDKNGNLYQKGGCGGFGKGNFTELFKSIEEYEKTLEGNHTANTNVA